MSFGSPYQKANESCDTCTHTDCWQFKDMHKGRDQVRHLVGIGFIKLGIVYTITFALSIRRSILYFLITGQLENQIAITMMGTAGSFGTDETPGNLLAGFGFYEPYWLIDFANACIAVQLCGGYQVLTQPFVRTAGVRARHLPALRLSFLRVIFRTTYVVVITGIALAFPYFNQVVGVSGAINFWPIVVYFPVQMFHQSSYCCQVQPPLMTETSPRNVL
ncbi:PREDICTED: probable amino acid permease 7 [Ipomoea nil]|uniref:probable amino acid permease 7 n=1 Tax=Ipomoea nil TaxID=35883 RepID=UPI000900EFF6|nr:PREDICTED: probable amino acid permease 7 [Ipomoea nil]